MGKESFILLHHTKEQRFSQALTPFRAVLELPERYISETIYIWIHAAIQISMEHARRTKGITQQNRWQQMKTRFDNSENRKDNVFYCPMSSNICQIFVKMPSWNVMTDKLVEGKLVITML